MMNMKALLLLPLVLSGVCASYIPILRSVENGACTGKGGASGVCITKGACSSGGGVYINGACPDQGENIKCCTKTECGTGNKGNCRFTSSCSSGVTETNHCPGPDNFKCCMPKGSSGGGGGGGGGGGSGGYPTPSLPTTSQGCERVAIDGADKIIEAFPGKVKIIYCVRKCSDPSSSDHCDGKATDMMVANGGVKTDAGQPIAEWVMKNRDQLNLKYVMWGQRIWNPGRDQVKPWNEWRYQSCISSHPNCVHGDRGDNTQNHWDHVHVSYE